MRALLIFALAAAALPAALTSCGRRPSVEEERQSVLQAQLQERTRELLNGIFIERDGYWFAAERRGSARASLVQFNRPRVTLVPTPVSETDRMNGVEIRCDLVFECSQSRRWDGNWSEWREGTDGAASLVNTFLAGGAFGYCAFQLELRHGKWLVRNKVPIHDFLVDRSRLHSLIAEASRR